LLEDGFPGEEASVSLDSLPEVLRGHADVASFGFTRNDMHAPSVIAQCVEVKREGDFEWTVVWADSTLDGVLCDDFWTRGSRLLGSISVPKYGYGYWRLKHLLPTMYPHGISFVGCTRVGRHGDEQAAIDEWFQDLTVTKRYAEGEVRDVFPRNYLQRVHLDRRVAAGTLEKYVLGDPLNGSIEAISETLFEWSVRPDQIGRVQRDLIEANLLVAPFIEDMPEGD
jgi:hypothetical protein